MYHMPLLKGPWMVAKAIYRLKKDGVTSGSVGWHQWLYKGNGDLACADIRTMASYARDHGAAFTVFLLPAVSCYEPGGRYALQDMYDDIMSFLKRNGIAYIDPIAAMGTDPDRYFTLTNHLHVEGDELLADMIRDHYLAGRNQ